MFRVISLQGYFQEIRSYPDGRMAVWNAERGWVPIWNGREHVNPRFK